MISESQQECYAQLGKTKVQAAPQLFIDLDVEADGKAGYGSLLSIGAVSPWGESFYEELQPTCDLWVPSQRDFCEAHGLQRERLLRKGIPPAAAIAKLTDWQAGLRSKHQKTNSVIVAFNASFDYPMIDLEYLRAGLKGPFGVAGYCIKSLAMALSDNTTGVTPGKNSCRRTFYRAVTLRTTPWKTPSTNNNCTLP